MAMDWTGGVAVWGAVGRETKDGLLTSSLSALMPAESFPELPESTVTFFCEQKHSKQQSTHLGTVLLKVRKKFMLF